MTYIKRKKFYRQSIDNNLTPEENLFKQQYIRVLTRMKRFIRSKQPPGTSSRLKSTSAVKLFVSMYGINIGIDNPTKQQIREWAVDLYLHGEIEGISREDKTFYSMPEWKALRKRVISAYGTTCMKCGCNDGEPHIDHIYPRSKFHHLQLDFNNMQVLCLVCNVKKSNKDYTDYRPKEITQQSPLRVAV